MCWQKAPQATGLLTLFSVCDYNRPNTAIWWSVILIDWTYFPACVFSVWLKSWHSFRLNSYLHHDIESSHFSFPYVATYVIWTLLANHQHFSCLSKNSKVVWKMYVNSNTDKSHIYSSQQVCNVKKLNFFSCFFRFVHKGAKATQIDDAIACAALQYYNAGLFSDTSTGAVARPFQFFH